MKKGETFASLLNNHGGDIRVVLTHLVLKGIWRHIMIQPQKVGEWASSGTRLIAIKFNLKTITDRGNLLEKLHEALVTINPKNYQN